jgi:hypothetical protein
VAVAVVDTGDEGRLTTMEPGLSETLTAAGGPAVCVMVAAPDTPGDTEVSVAVIV